MRPPRTAYILLWFPKASETFIFNEVNTLRKLGLPVMVFCLYGTRAAGLSPEMEAGAGDVERLGLPLLKKIFADFLYWWKRDRRCLVKLLWSVPEKRWRGLEKTAENMWALLCSLHLARRFQEEKIEHIHAPWAGGPATAAWQASLLTGIPFSFTAHARDIYPTDGVLSDKIHNATFVRNISQHNIDYMKKFAGNDMGKIHLTYYGVPLKETGPAPVAMQAPLQLLALGRFVGKKGFDHLIRCCRILLDSGLDFQLTLAGDGPHRKRLKQLARRLGLDKRISFPGFIPHNRVPALLRTADIFLMPSVVHSSGDRDGLPNVLLEAMLHRVPVISTDIVGIPELITNGVNGVLVPEKDPAALARAVRQLAGSRQAALAMAEQGRKVVLNKFDSGRNYQKVMDLIIANSAPGPAEALSTG
ncbi:MAG: glycosyltransferase family 4 protein [Desulfobacterales bacterium]|nr:glycosyltransferase family 4 protein [Desulfobacterales bacterium]